MAISLHFIRKIKRIIVYNFGWVIYEKVFAIKLFYSGYYLCWSYMNLKSANDTIISLEIRHGSWLLNHFVSSGISCVQDVHIYFKVVTMCHLNFSNKKIIKITKRQGTVL